jgi:ACT domain-containing protein
MATDITISVPDKPGELARIGETLGKAGVNIEGVVGLGVQGRGIIHVLVEDAAGARKALEGAGIEVSGEAEALVFDLSADADRPGALGKMARKVADAGVNVIALYLATGSRGVAVTSDNKKALAALK